MTRFFAPAALLLLAVSPAFADSVTNTVLAFDRKAGLIVLTDRTVFTLSATDAMAPENLVAGDTVKITYDSLGEDGYGQIQTIEIVE
ncbi:MAG: hypothetical protein LJE68_18885 [Rhodobacter sp.]|nr:hypothetical protein [Rhodobacter sp.]